MNHVEDVLLPYKLVFGDRACCALLIEMEKCQTMNYWKKIKVPKLRVNQKSTYDKSRMVTNETPFDSSIMILRSWLVTEMTAVFTPNNFWSKIFQRILLRPWTLSNIFGTTWNSPLQLDHHGGWIIALLTVSSPGQCHDDCCYPVVNWCQFEFDQHLALHMTVDAKSETVHSNCRQLKHKRIR